jgi:hypothetical protein
MNPKRVRSRSPFIDIVDGSDDGRARATEHCTNPAAGGKLRAHRDARRKDFS